MNIMAKIKTYYVYAGYYENFIRLKADGLMMKIGKVS